MIFIPRTYILGWQILLSYLINIQICCYLIFETFFWFCVFKLAFFLSNFCGVFWIPFAVKYFVRVVVFNSYYSHSLDLTSTTKKISLAKVTNYPSLLSPVILSSRPFISQYLKMSITAFSQWLLSPIVVSHCGLFPHLAFRMIYIYIFIVFLLYQQLCLFSTLSSFLFFYNH